ncbi:hypothetical protein Tco_1350210, partial [Tanacetum coccineum]
MKLATKRSLIETYGSHANGSGAAEGTGSIPGVPDVPTYGSDDEKISWKSSDEEDDVEVALNDDDDDNNDDDENDDDNDDADNQDDDGYEYDEHDDEEQSDDDEQTDSDNDGDDFVHPKFSTHDEEDKEEDSFDPRVQTPSYVESTNDEVSYEEIQDANREEDKDEEPSAGSNWGSKRRRAGKEPESTSAPKEKTSKITGKSTEGSKSHHKSAGESAHAEEPMHTAKDLEEPAHQEFKTGVTKDQPNEETFQYPDCFQKPAKPPTPDRDWKKTLPDAHGLVQPWLSSLAQMEDPHESFNDLMDTPLDFSAFVMNRLKVDTLTPDLLASLTFELMKGSCKSL